MGMEAIYPKPRTTRPAAGHKIYPYLLRNLAITRPDQVWSSDITYVPLRHGFLYLVAVIDWYSRYVLAWRLSNTLDGTFLPGGAGRGAGRAAAGDLQHRSRERSSRPRRSPARLETRGVAISMDGRGRALDNVFVERLWRSVKYEEVYLKDYADGWEAEAIAGALLPTSTASGGSTRRWATARRRRCTGRAETREKFGAQIPVEAGLTRKVKRNAKREPATAAARDP